MQNISLVVHGEKPACLPWHAAQHCGQGKGFWGFTLHHTMLSNTLCSTWPEEPFLWFSFHFLIFFWSLWGGIQKTWPSSYDLHNSVVKLSSLSLRRRALGKWGLLFTCLEHKNNIRIFFWEYNSDKQQESIFEVVQAPPTWVCPVFLKMSSASKHPLCLIWDRKLVGLMSALGFNVWADRGRLINSLSFSADIHFCRTLPALFPFCRQISFMVS